MIHYISKSEKLNSSTLHKSSLSSKVKIKNNKTQLLLNRLLVGKKITARDAAFDLNIFMLRDIVYRLRRFKNIPVKTKLIKSIDSYGQTIKFAEYFLEEFYITEIKSKDYLQ